MRCCKGDISFVLVIGICHFRRLRHCLSAYDILNKPIGCCVKLNGIDIKSFLLTFFQKSKLVTAFFKKVEDKLYQTSNSVLREYTLVLCL